MYVGAVVLFVGSDGTVALFVGSDGTVALFVENFNSSMESGN
jgi:hypothetical protein